MNNDQMAVMVEGMAGSELKKCTQSENKKSWGKTAVSNTAYTASNIQELDPKIRFSYSTFAKKEQCSGTPEMIMGVPFNQSDSVLGSASVVGCDTAAKQVLMNLNGTRATQPLGCTQNILNGVKASTEQKCLGEYQPHSISTGGRVSAGPLSFPMLAAAVMGIIFA